ncbi:hypothetical protein scyTo_0000047 [Scyliorhinus torazame]|uniref:Retrotransposon gag domain-containing protein n=1 Tax=Scyliorhinus torazame TaxID=75743 RepID=A0A401NNU7_SCYTO|nr:hypothetical protein [Scyliorhinus torazame]
MKYFFRANNIIPDEKQSFILLTACRPAAFAIMRSLTFPEAPDTKTFQELTDLVKECYDPEPPLILRRYWFYSAFRDTGESVTNFLTRLTRLAEACEFGLTLYEMLRDHLVCAINNLAKQKHLLGEAKLDCKQALQLALSLEKAASGAHELQGTPMESIPVKLS